MRFFATLASSAVFVATVHAHGALTAVTGANGVTGAGFGIDPSTPRNGASPNPFEQDTSIIRNNEIASGKASPCGRTKIGGVNDIAANLAKATTAGLPSAGANGEVTMTLHQVNQDGAGPYACEVNTDGTGNTFTAVQVTQNVPGFAGLSFTTATDIPLTAQLAAGTTCTGGPSGNACIVRCRNQALAGPFGGCVAVTMGGAAAAAGGNATAAAPAAAAAAPAAAAAAPATAAAATGGKGGLAGLLGKLGGGAAAGGAAAGGQAGLGGLLGKFGLHKRVINSRIVSRANAGRWM